MHSILNIQGQNVLTIESKGTPPFGDGNPIGIATDCDGSVYTATSDDKLHKINRHGEVMKSIWKRGYCKSYHI